MGNEIRWSDTPFLMVANGDSAERSLCMEYTSCDALLVVLRLKCSIIEDTLFPVCVCVCVCYTTEIMYSLHVHV